MGNIWDKPYHTRRKETDDLAKQYGLDRDDYVSTDIDGERGMTDDDYKKYERAISDAAANDYDTRRSIEAAQLAGYEGANDLGKGISNLEEASNAHKFLQNIHENELGNSGKFSSANDYGNVANFFVKNDREKFTEDMEGKFSDYVKENTPEPADETNQQSEEIAFSPQLQAAQQRVTEHEQNMNSFSGKIYGYDTEDALEKSTDALDDAKPYSDGQAQRNTAAQNFHKDYKIGLMEGLRENPFGTTTTTR